MSSNTSISVAKTDNLGWVRCDAKGSFSNSSQIESWVLERIKEGLTKFVIDLEKCTGMDSTFMGNLAGLAMKVRPQGGALQVTDASQKCESSLQDLGLSTLIDINPEQADWKGREKEIRDSLISIEPLHESVQTNAGHVYKTHKYLCEADITNQVKFSEVLKCLESDINNSSKK